MSASQHYRVSPELNERTLRILKARLPALEEALNSHFKVFFSTAKQDHWGGKTHIVEPSMRFDTGVEFVILIDEAEYSTLDDIGKDALLCHELYHIMRSPNGAPKLRRHAYLGGIDFCELPQHDAFSQLLARSVAR